MVFCIGFIFFMLRISWGIYEFYFGVKMNIGSSGVGRVYGFIFLNEVDILLILWFGIGIECCFCGGVFDVI